MTEALNMKNYFKQISSWLYISHAAVTRISEQIQVAFDNVNIFNLVVNLVKINCSFTVG